MADKEESGEQILSKTIDLANQTIKFESGNPSSSVSLQLERLKKKVEWLVLLKKEAFELANSGYLTATLLPFLIRTPPAQLKEGVIILRKEDEWGHLFERGERLNGLTSVFYLTKGSSEYQVSRMIGLLGLILMHDGYMSPPPYSTRVYDYPSLLLRFVGLRDSGQTMFESLLELLRKGSVHDKLIGVMALGIFAQRSGTRTIVGQLVANGVIIDLVKILNEGPMLLQAEVTHVIYKFIEIDSTICNKFPLDDVVESLKILLVATFDEFLVDHTIMEKCLLQLGDPSSLNTRMRKMAYEVLLVLAKHKYFSSSDIIEWLHVVAFSLYFLGIEESVLTTEGNVRESFLLKMLKEGSVGDKFISVTATGGITQQSRNIEHLVAAGVMVELGKILKEGPMALQYEVAQVIYKFIERDSTICNKLPLDDVVESLKLLLVATFDELLVDHTIMEKLQLGDPSSLNTRMRKMAYEVLLVLVKHKYFSSSDIIEWLHVVAFSLHFLGIEESVLTTEGNVRELFLLKMLKEGSVSDKFISVTAIRGIAQQSKKINNLVAAGVVEEFGKILNKGPMGFLYATALAISLFLDINPFICHNLPLDSLIASLVRHLQVEVTEDQFQEHVNKATSVLSIVAARHNSNRRKVNDDKNEESKLGEKIQFPPGFKARMRVLAANILKVLTKDNVSVCRIIVEKGAHLCFAALLQDTRLDVRLSSAVALMEITAVVEKDTELRRSAFRHNSYALKFVVDQLIRIIEDAPNGINVGQSIQQISSTPELLVSCVKAIGNLAATFRDTRPITPLVHLLESANNEVSKECLTALTKFVCKDCFLHLDHSRVIINSGGLTFIIRLAVDETIGLQKHALLLLCYVSLDAIGNQSDKSKEALSAINIASRIVKFSKDEIVELQLVQQAKRRLG